MVRSNTKFEGNTWRKGPLALLLQNARWAMLKPLLQSLSELDQKIQPARNVALFLDFDGTLAPIVDEPSDASLPAGVRDVLERLVRLDSIVTTIISGRAVEDVYVRIRLEGVIYAGNHGVEIFGRGLTFIEPTADSRRDQLRRLAEVVAAKLENVEGVRVEDKGLTVSIHTRQVSVVDVPIVEEAVRTSVAAAGALFRLNKGRRVFEILPRTGWHKGAAVQWILNHLPGDGTLPIYLGDDSSDEDAFAVLTDAVTVRVGAPLESCAQYRIPGPAEAYQFLVWLENRMAPAELAKSPQTLKPGRGLGAL